MKLARCFSRFHGLSLAVFCSIGCLHAQTSNPAAQTLSAARLNAALPFAAMPALVGAAPSNAMPITGADRTCKSDSSTAINNGIAAAAAAGKAAYLPAGCYAHNTLIILDGAKLYGAGDATELRATGAVKSYQIGGWTIGQDGAITLSLDDNRDMISGSPVDVSGITGVDCSGSGPNGTGLIVSDAQASFVKYRPKDGSCRPGSGKGGTITSKFPLTAIVLKGNGAELHDVKAVVQWSGGRTGLDQSSAVLNKSSNFVVDHVHLIGSGGAPGYYCDGCTHGSETHNVVENTKADGMEHHGCAAFLTNSDNRAVATGDDSFSVNSYEHDSCPSHDITFTNDVSVDSFNRGFDVDGGTNITIRGGSVTNAKSGCILIHSGGNYRTLKTDTVTVDSTTLDGCATAGIWIAAAQGGTGSTSNITIENVHGKGIRNEGIHIGEPGGTTSGVHVLNCTFESASGGAHPGVFLAPAPKQMDNVEVKGVTFKGFGQQCIQDPGGHSAAISGATMNCDGKSISRAADAIR